MTAAYWSDGAAGPVLALFEDLLGDAAGPLAWEDRALCKETDPEIFFPEQSASARDARRVCMACEVRAQCLEYALSRDERWGVWGGLSERERWAIKRGRDRSAA